MMSRRRHLVPFRKYARLRIARDLAADRRFRRSRQIRRQSRPSELSNISSMLASAVGLRVVEPLKMTSVRASPRNCRAELSPMTQRTASMMFDLPHPLGPTMAQRFPGKVTVVGSTKDLKPASLICLSRIDCLRVFPELRSPVGS